MPSPQLILIEFNELCPSLLRRFMDQGMLPHFRRFHDAATVWTTDAQETPPNLEPWIQWPTVHSGLPFAEHGVFHLGDGRAFQQKCLAEILSDAGIPVGVCASMNLNYRQLNGYIMPDPWDKEGAAHPDWLQPFYDTVSRQVQEASRAEGLTLGQLGRFGWFMLRNGLSAGTIAAIGKQLLHEQVAPGIRWRRACLLDRMLYDVFRSLNRRLDVRFASFFCNSTAHFQHYYWRNMEPEHFDAPVPATDDPSLQDAIPHGYQAMDRLLGQMMRDYPATLLVLCGALSQQPWTDTTKCTFRPRRFESLLEFAQVSAPHVRVKPVMAEEFHLECPTAEQATVVEARFRELTVANQPLMKVERTGNTLFTGCGVTDATMLDQSVKRQSDGTGLPFRELFYMIHTMRSGRHHPDGVLWVRNGCHQVVDEHVPLTAIAPTVLRFFGIDPPPAMQAQPLFWEKHEARRSVLV
jgi:hypothetical protein